MSAWYVWSALGLFPVDPCSNTYALGRPVLEQASLSIDPRPGESQRGAGASSGSGSGPSGSSGSTTAQRAPPRPRRMLHLRALGASASPPRKLLKVRWNGRELKMEEPFLRHEDLLEGGSLEFLFAEKEEEDERLPPAKAVKASSRVRSHVPILPITVHGGRFVVHPGCTFRVGKVPFGGFRDR